MRFVTGLWNLLRQGLGLVLPLFSKARDFRGLGAGLRWAIHIIPVAAILVGLYVVNVYCRLDTVLRNAPGELKNFWLPSLFVLVYALSWLGWCLWKLLWEEEETSNFLDISNLSEPEISETQEANPRDDPPVGDDTAWPDVPGYRISRELGRGGMGVVYRAWQESLDRPVALKVILAAEYAGQEERHRFRAEAETAARLQHPNIVQVYDIGEHQGRPFFAMELVDGASVAQKSAGRRMPLHEAAVLIETVARAVDHAHQRRVIHRDLKPANVLLSTGGTPKVTDFGLAKRLDRAAAHTQSGAVLGTPSYMAPEQAGGKAKYVGPAADVYALGAILYELVTGRPPFRAETTLETLLQVMSEEAVPPTQLRPDCPSDLEAICLKCLQKKPEQRYASAAALAEDLHCFLAGEPIQAPRREAGHTGPSRRRVRRTSANRLSEKGNRIAKEAVYERWTRRGYFALALLLIALVALLCYLLFATPDPA
jgi:serine/threonine protein kinase